MGTPGMEQDQLKLIIIRFMGAVVVVVHILLVL
jgi:hypothetical protein